MEVGGRLMRLAHQLNVAGMRNFPATPSTRLAMDGGGLRLLPLSFGTAIDGQSMLFLVHCPGLYNVCFVSPQVSRSFDMIEIAVCPRRMHHF